MEPIVPHYVKRAERIHRLNYWTGILFAAQYQLLAVFMGREHLLTALTFGVVSFFCIRWAFLEAITGPHFIGMARFVSQAEGREFRQLSRDEQLWFQKTLGVVKGDGGPRSLLRIFDWDEESLCQKRYNDYVRSIVKRVEREA